MAYGILEKTAKGIMITYIFVCSLDEDTEYMGIKADVLQEDTLAPCLFIILLDHALKTLDEHQNHKIALKKASSRRHLPKNVNDAHFADDLAILSGKIGDVEILLYKVEHTAESVSLHINSRKIKFMALNTTGPMKVSG